MNKSRISIFLSYIDSHLSYVYRNRRNLICEYKQRNPLFLICLKFIRTNRRNLMCEYKQRNPFTYKAESARDTERTTIWPGFSPGVEPYAFGRRQASIVWQILCNTFPPVYCGSRWASPVTVVLVYELLVPIHKHISIFSMGRSSLVTHCVNISMLLTLSLFVTLPSLFLTRAQR